MSLLVVLEVVFLIFLIKNKLKLFLQLVEFQKKINFMV